MAKFFAGLAIPIILIAIWFGTAGSLYRLEGEGIDADDGEFPDSSAEVIVCLAGARGRLSSCGETWLKLGGKSVLYLSGVGKKTSWSVFESQSKPEVMKVIRAEQVVFENVSLNTIENARYFKSILIERGWKKILLMTSSYHMKRSLYIFQEVLKDVPGIQLKPETIWSEPFTASHWFLDEKGFQVTAWEYLKWLFYRGIIGPFGGIK